MLGKTFNCTFRRNGEDPTVQKCDSFEQKVNLMKAKIDEYIKKGYKRIAIVCKNNKECLKYKDYFKDFTLVSEDDKDIVNVDKLIVSVLLSKGLEFDAVIIPDANDESYHEDRERQVLYVACTRALHRLALFYEGNITKFLSQTK